MKINFLVPTLGITGGMHVIFQYANQLSKKGHQINIIHPYILPKNAGIKITTFGYLKKIRYTCLRLLGKGKIDWFPLDKSINIIKPINLDYKHIPKADAIIATANETADWLNDYPNELGSKFYFIQDYENWTRAVELVDRTWKMPLKKIVISSGLKNLAENKFQEKIVGLVTNGIDLKIFQPINPTRPNNPIKILMMNHELPKKGIEDGIEAYKIAKKINPNIELTMFGAYNLAEKFKKIVTDYYYKPTQEKIAELYSAADIFIWPSREEGFGLPPMEAMACGAAVLSTDTGAIRDYAIPNTSVIIVPPRNPQKLAEELINLINKPNLRLSLGKEAQKNISQYSWNKSADKLEKILLANLK
ncbi:MAG TPA: glycosyltransferase family 4 protein [bacterium]|nr:glycosyltransferase family 4 protein [bacterium]